MAAPRRFSSLGESKAGNRRQHSSMLAASRVSNTCILRCRMVTLKFKASRIAQRRTALSARATIREQSQTELTIRPAYQKYPAFHRHTSLQLHI